MIFKKAQTGESLTWIVATIIIFVMMAVFVFLAGSLNVISGRDNSFILYEVKDSDLLAVKSFSAYLLTDKFYEKISSDGNLNSETGQFGKSVFTFIFNPNEKPDQIFGSEDSLADIIVGIYTLDLLNNEISENLYFPKANRNVLSYFTSGGRVIDKTLILNYKLNRDRAVILMIRLESVAKF